MSAILSAGAQAAPCVPERPENEGMVATASGGTDVEKQSRDLERIWKASESFLDRGLNFSLYFGRRHFLMIGVDNANSAELKEIAEKIGKIEFEIIQVRKIRPIFLYRGRPKKAKQG